ncbi:hypothetical protein ACLE1A_002379 [Cronobacter turicensis]
MKIKIKNKSEGQRLNSKIKLIVIIYASLSILIMLSMSFEKDITEPYKLLLVSPSLYNYQYLNWVTGAWGSILGIHGTIAALSITFMSMFVTQVSTYSEHGFESICKNLLLREHSFLEFSVQSICSLLSGIFLLLVGSGLVGYFISAFLSLYFIVKYGVMYYKLYNVTENPEIINLILFDKLKNTCKEHDDIISRRIMLEGAFTSMISKFSNVKIRDSSVFSGADELSLKVLPSQSSLVLSGFNEKYIEKAAKKLSTLNLESSPIIKFDISFFSPLSFSSVKLLPPSDVVLPQRLVHEIESILRKSLYYSHSPYVFIKFKRFEQALASNLKNSLKNGNEWSLDFGIKAFFELTSNKNYLQTLQAIDLSISSLHKKDDIDLALFAKFFYEMSSTALNKKDNEMASNIMGGILNLSRYILSNDNFNLFYKKIFTPLTNRVKYHIKDSELIFLDLYLKGVTHNFAYGYYGAFELDTNFITSTLRYLNSHGLKDRETLNDMQRKLLRCVLEVITLLIMRIEHLLNKDGMNDEEIKHLTKHLRSWVSAKFLEELYYKEESYELLFSIPSNYSVFSAETRIREIPDGEATWRSVKNDTLKMIALFLTHGSFNNNRFDLIFIRDVKKLQDKAKIATHQLDSIIKYLNDESYSRVIELTAGTPKVKANKEIVISQIESLKSSIKESVLEELISCDLNDDLVQQYIELIENEIENHLSLIVELDQIPTSSHVQGMSITSLFNKREVVLPVDGVSFSMNTTYQSRNLIYKWIETAILSIKEKTIIPIKNLDELNSEKIISLQYKLSSKTSTFNHLKGKVLTDDSGVLQLNGAGIYYFNLMECFKFKKSSTLLNIDIKKISQENIAEVEHEFNDGDGNPYLYSVLHAFFNIEYTLLDECKIYFLSLEQAKSLNEKEEDENHTLFAEHVNSSNDDKLMNIQTQP